MYLSKIKLLFETVIVPHFYWIIFDSVETGKLKLFLVIIKVSYTNFCLVKFRSKTLQNKNEFLKISFQNEYHCIKYILTIVNIPLKLSANKETKNDFYIYLIICSYDIRRKINFPLFS